EYNFNVADIDRLRKSFSLAEAEASMLIDKGLLLPAYDMCLKCSHLFNLLDARGAVSVTERVKTISQIRSLVVRVAQKYCADQGRT
ncbi:MAG TPA: glycine--tRNA ligase subunit alpha, partial [Candidatus Aminicenantes bacterium]|nr:glycine--tRNA ligase subunit alpha [Candidatus Aminicenantes bacterium]